ncbi:hypothetical protein JOF56_008910 [Kibdelosporangium banguiense]|uniref:DUF5753 domain-containing protein n=1 Tax=Kibdelosporangium banguiense TaxID=1365924 RepID=A0ABS4TVT8_9PSEU|nr:hypothetical protein [Kibdelosporangium banguiense]MBP2328525.1 hypothetical protein [Kibdelosporangium banguiense]
MSARTDPAFYETFVRQEIGMPDASAFIGIREKTHAEAGLS